MKRRRIDRAASHSLEGVSVQRPGESVADGRWRRLLLLAAALVAVVMVATATACGRGASPPRAPGGFGTGGKVLTEFGSSDSGASAVAIQADGKIVAAGGSGSDFALARYTPTGHLDPRFAKGGKVVTDVGARPADNSEAYWEHGANAVAIQGDGKIVAAGAGDGVFALVRYTRDGRLDRSFGTGGKVLTDFAGDASGGGAYAKAVAVQADGEIIAAGRSGYDLALARYTSEGRLDRSFGTGGKVLTGLGLDYGWADAVAIEADGRIIAAGGRQYTGKVGTALVRYTPDGRLDRSFGMGGKVFAGLDGNADALAVQADGKIVAAGECQCPGAVAGAWVSRFALARYLPNGRLDPSFGPPMLGTQVLTGFGSGGGASAVAVQGDGKIVAAGWTRATEPKENVALVRYTSEGRLDRSFGTGGKVVTGFSRRHRTSAAAVAIQGDGKIVVAGASGPRVGTSPWARGDFALARYTAEGRLDS